MYFLLKMVIFHCYVSLPEGSFLWDGLVSGQLFFCQLFFCRSEIVPETGGTLEVTWREIMASGRSSSKHRKDVQKNVLSFW